MRVVFFLPPPFFFFFFFFFFFSEKDISDLELPTGDTLIVMESVGEMQAAKGRGPLCTTQMLTAAELSIGDSDTKGPM